jgi:hypothetical protein
MPSMPFVLLWVELEPVSFANLTREEEPEFPRLAPTFSTVT